MSQITEKDNHVPGVAVVETESPKGTAGQIAVVYRVLLGGLVVALQDVSAKMDRRQVVRRTRVLAEIVVELFRIARVPDELTVRVLADDEVVVVLRRFIERPDARFLPRWSCEQLLPSKWDDGRCLPLTSSETWMLMRMSSRVLGGAISPSVATSSGSSAYRTELTRSTKSICLPARNCRRYFVRTRTLWGPISAATSSEPSRLILMSSVPLSLTHRLWTAGIPH